MLLVVALANQEVVVALVVDVVVLVVDVVVPKVVPKVVTRSLLNPIVMKVSLLHVAKKICLLPRTLSLVNLFMVKSVFQWMVQKVPRLNIVCGILSDPS